MDQKSATALLEQHHEFPGDFVFRVVVKPEVKATVVSVMMAATEGCAELVQVEEHPSKTGKYLSLRVSMRVESAQVVLDVYHSLKSVTGVLATL